MKAFLLRLLRPQSVWWVLGACLLTVVAIGWIATSVERAIIRSRTATQQAVAGGWSAAGIVVADHTIVRGENFWSVAKRYGVDIDTIVGSNPGMERLHASTGQLIRVPNRRGVIHVVAQGEGLASVAAAYDVDALVLAEVNGLPERPILPPDLELFIPDVKPLQLADAMEARYRLRGIFGSPLSGRITSAMGMRKHPVGGFRGKHTGIDLAAPKGSRISAAAAGTVTDTGEGEYIGKYLILSHKDGYSTLYGHCSEVLVKKGERVKRGQLIAKVGDTGRVTGAHLHFEIRRNAIPQDPLAYLW